LDQVAKAIIFLRSVNLSHRDVKSANIFVSDDFERATVLDLSVLREIDDPFGIGTDHDNQLPVVATIRYTPPEYLFRLQDPTSEFWHGVDVYQLGGLLHDLIMRRPMFSTEYAASIENRYRFAWIVATVDPVIKAVDVDADLILLARQALDKNWERRRLLRLEDFTLESGGYGQSLAAIGIASTPRPQASWPVAPTPADAVNLAHQIEVHVTEYLKEYGQLAVHSNEAGSHDLARVLKWKWSPGAGNVASEVELEVTLALRINAPRAKICVEALFKAWIDDEPHSAVMELPDTDHVAGAEEDVFQQIVASLGPLSKKAMRAHEGAR